MIGINLGNTHEISITQLIDPLGSISNCSQTSFCLPEPTENFTREQDITIFSNVVASFSKFFTTWSSPSVPQKLHILMVLSLVVKQGGTGASLQSVFSQ